ncbi:hypothetical protein [Agrococcus sp. SGAir0287]|uniref:hypothetical protein n=1 Tax=Agrococcus sp. SGAir0287 TaxID=2070347 RepID=UPI0010CD470C|nr:hypothetical protein [Agrococcus sp. SGAir0287]QCR18463.1 hypothetical protein C1N71_02520 [Agrococcus sp. SGAir0287]
MSALEERFRALLRWYPRAWRERDGEVLLATLLDDAEARGLEEPTAADAWSIRVHGLAARMTPATAALAAAVGLALYVCAMLVQSAGLMVDPHLALGVDGATLGAVWQILVVVATTAVGTPLVAIALLALARSRLGAGAGSSVAAALAVLVAGAIQAADAVRTIVAPVVATDLVSITGVAQPTATLVAAVVAGVGLLSFVHDLVLRPSGLVARWLVAFACTAALVGVGVAVSMTGLVWVIAFAVLVLALSTEVRRRHDADDAAARGEWRPAPVAMLSGAAILLGAPSMLSVAASSALPGMVREEGLWQLFALAILGTTLLLVALAIVGSASVGTIAWFAGGAGVAASAATIIAVLLGIASAQGQLVLWIASAMAGAAVACTLLPIAPGGGPALRAAIAVAVGVTLAAFALQALPFVLGLLWLGAIPLLVVAGGRHRRARERRRSLESTAA